MCIDRQLLPDRTVPRNVGHSHQKERDRARANITVATAILEAEINQYRRRRPQAQRARESRNQLPNFATELLKFAQSWAA